jgi:integrase
MNWFPVSAFPASEHYASPIIKGMKRDKRKPKERARKRWLNNDEIRTVWKAAGELSDEGNIFGPLVKFLLLTAQRREKPARMKHDDLQNGIWTIAVEDREKGVVGRIKLPQMARDILADLPVKADNPFVFAGRGKKAFNRFSQGMDELRAVLPKDMTHWTLHDLRRTARKLLTRAKVRPDVGELAIGHSLKGIRAVYDDIDEYEPFLDEAFQALADEIAKVLNPPPADNVVRMRRSARGRQASASPVAARS